jgi:hypothetical protein
MAIISAAFVDREAMLGAMLALAGDDILSRWAEVLHPAPQENVSPSNLGGLVGSAVGGSLGAIAAASLGAVAVVASGGTLLAVGTALAATSGAAAGGMAGVLLGTVIGGSGGEQAHEGGEIPVSVVLNIEVADGDEALARLLLEGSGGEILGPPEAASAPLFELAPSLIG